MRLVWYSDESVFSRLLTIQELAVVLTLCFILLHRVVKEEISDDNAKLPCFNGRVVSWVSDLMKQPCTCGTHTRTNACMPPNALVCRSCGSSKWDRLHRAFITLSYAILCSASWPSIVQWINSMWSNALICHSVAWVALQCCVITRVSPGDNKGCPIKSSCHVSREFTFSLFHSHWRMKMRLKLWPELLMSAIVHQAARFICRGAFHCRFCFLFTPMIRNNENVPQLVCIWFLGIGFKGQALSK